MAKVSPEGAEVNARIVYWGIEGAGKKTSLANVATKLRPDHRGSMQEVPTPFDPSASYVVMPIELGEIAGLRTRIEMVAVPGEVEHQPTRKQLLDQVDGIVFVADSRVERIEENVASFEELRKSLADYGRTIEDMPLVIQYNKRDLADPFAIEELHRRLAVGNAAAFEAVATEGTGLLQTLSTISKKVIRTLREQSLDARLTRTAEPPAESTAPATYVDAPRPEPSILEPPLAEPRLSPSEALEEAILAEADHPDNFELDVQTHETESLLDPWNHEDDLEAPLGARVGAGLTIVSVGEARRADDQTVQVPLVLGDAEGETSTLLLSIRLDPLVDEGNH